MGVTETGCKGVDQIHLALNRGKKCPAFMDTKFHYFVHLLHRHL
jgi:hypothetical protein